MVSVAQSYEWEENFIPPCVLEVRLEHEANRAERNTAARAGEVGYPAYSPLCVTYANTGDGDVLVTCPGNGSDCSGAEVKVDRHDLMQPRMPEVSTALGSICTSGRMYARRTETALLARIKVDHSK
jgi:hypothetical protein